MAKTKKKRGWIGWPILGLLVLLVLIWWIAMKPTDDLQITGKYVLGENQTVLSMADPEEPLANAIATKCENMPGYDEFLPLPDGKTALTTCMDGWVYKVDLENWTAEKFVDAPLEAAGAVLDPLDENRVYLCSSYLYGEEYPEDEHPGIYALDLTTKKVTPIVERVPVYEYQDPVDGKEGRGTIYTDGSHSMKVKDMTEDNSMICAFCNDLDISRDGKRIYWSEPFSYEGAAMGGGMNIYETISLGEHGRIWCYDLDKKTIRLVIDGLSFADGLLLEYPDADAVKESSILVCETIRYCITRASLLGDETSGSVLWGDLPGMCDGLGKDENGNIWVGLLHARSAAIDKVYAHPWMKQILLRMPKDLFSGSEGCGLIALDPTASKCLYYTLYSGENISDIPVAVGTQGKVFLPSFVKEQKGLHYIENPLMKS